MYPTVVARSENENTVLEGESYAQVEEITQGKCHRGGTNFDFDKQVIIGI